MEQDRDRRHADRADFTEVEAEFYWAVRRGGMTHEKAIEFLRDCRTQGERP